MQDNYAVLGLDSDATIDEVKKTYRTLAMQFHPDKTKNDSILTNHFRKITEAYDAILDKKPVKSDTKTNHGDKPKYTGIIDLNIFGNLHGGLCNQDDHVLKIEPGRIDGDVLTFDLPDKIISFTIKLMNHPNFTVKGLDLYCRLSVPLSTLTKGKSFHVPYYPKLFGIHLNFKNPGRDFVEGELFVFTKLGLRKGENERGSLYVTLNIIDDRWAIQKLWDNLIGKSQGS